MSFDVEQFLSGLGIPYLKCFAQRSTGQALAVRTVCKTEDAFRVTLEHARHRVRMRIPHLDRAVERSTGQASAVRTIRQAPNRVRMPLESNQLLATLRVPDSYQLVV